MTYDCQSAAALNADVVDAGECTRNEEYMVGNDAVLGQCRASCKACEVCTPSDQAGRTRNRVNAGLLALQDGHD